MKVEDVQPVPAEECRPERCGKYIIINGQGVPNTDGECQKKKPADGTAWYAMQHQDLCQKWMWPGPVVSKDPCWCVVPKCKPVKCGSSAAPAGSKCYPEEQPNMECRQSENLCKEIRDPMTGGELFFYV